MELLEVQYEQKMLYEFEECKPNEVKYCVEFIGEKSKENANDYFLFLEDMGYKVFFKNINLLKAKSIQNIHTAI